MKASNTGLGAAVLLIHAVAAPTLAAQNTADTQDTSGQQLFEAHCATCHQFDGGGVPMMQPAITGISRAKQHQRRGDHHDPTWQCRHRPRRQCFHE